ncbi:MAG: glycoside hydrolase family protein [Jaaginema sp. PMC 1079.18]|nr:glycoside hydrolase family protein [Jaaginema sp. PMC 1080.18]MEC4850239.1 glycoside hydrolase family protein [Jaaginema sp. PMC 1079.18]MEC4867297.1 glycoside hydrolase family protein [Jaaginema sp. PMC 1078.18]
MRSRYGVLWALGLAVAIALIALPFPDNSTSSQYRDGTQPLVMTGGDPYIRALMRTISASEANDPQPYNLLYGGDRFTDFSRHPQRCVPIVTGPNRGNCTTAAGRYQFINTTWGEQAARYHPQGKTGFLWWRTYNFAPQYQDQVVYLWLSDRYAWDADITQLLKDGDLETVLQLLSTTWTSLGYGIETNVMSSQLPSIYQRLLQEELSKK